MESIGRWETIKTESFWKRNKSDITENNPLGQKLFWEIRPNFGAFCITDADLRNEVRKSTGRYVDVCRANDIHAVCKSMWKKHKQNYVLDEMTNQNKGDA